MPVGFSSPYFVKFDIKRNEPPQNNIYLPLMGASALDKILGQWSPYLLNMLGV